MEGAEEYTRLCNGVTYWQSNPRRLSKTPDQLDFGNTIRDMANFWNRVMTENERMNWLYETDGQPHSRKSGDSQQWSQFAQFACDQLAIQLYEGPPPYADPAIGITQLDSVEFLSADHVTQLIQMTLRFNSETTDWEETHVLIFQVNPERLHTPSRLRHTRLIGIWQDWWEGESSYIATYHSGYAFGPDAPVGILAWHHPQYDCRPAVYAQGMST